MRPLSPLESVALLSLAGSVLAVFVPTFVRQLHASRLVEPIDGLGHIGARALALADGKPPRAAFPPSVGLTPKDVPSGQSVEDPEGTWDEPTWRALDFRLERAHYYAFAFESENKPQLARFTARALGDLDGDGLFSTFKVEGEVRAGAMPVLFPLEMDREVE
jgi:hypothetical protein